MRRNIRFWRKSTSGSPTVSAGGASILIRKYLRTGLWAGVLSFTVGVLVILPILSAVIPSSASANSGDGTFQYSDSSSSTVIESSPDGQQVYNKTTGGHYAGGNADGFNGCTAVILTSDGKYGGDTNAQWYASCLGGREGQKSITITKAPTYVGTWIDHSHLQIANLNDSNDPANGIYYDGGIDNNNSYSELSQPNQCTTNKVDSFYGGGDPRNAGAAGKAQITVNSPVGNGNNNCTPHTFPVAQFQQTQNYAQYFMWVDGGTIQSTDGDITFTQNGSSGPFLTSDTCQSQITPDSSDPTHGTLIIRYSGNNPFSQGYPPQFYQSGLFSSQSGCQVSKPLQVNISNPNNANKAAPGSGGPSASSSSSDDIPGCPSILQVASNPLAWIICPVVYAMETAITFTDNIITDELTIPTQTIFCSGSSDSSTCDSYYTAWVSFRNIALGLMVIAGLIIVISQALGMEVLDAYTVRKTLPRLLVAAIGITLSWTLMNFLVTLSNDLGFGVRALITAPFKSLSDTANFNFVSGGGAGGGFINFITGGAVVAGAGVAAWIATGGIGILLSYVATAGLAVLIAVLVLILRQIAIIMLILIAPIAIIAYVLPNTQRIFRFWWDSFSRALLMFPLIAAFLATGRVFAAISLQGNPDPVHGIIGFAAYFAPYFLIPLTFRFAGGALSSIGGFVSQQGQGAFGSLRGYRSGKRKERVAAARSGGLYRGANSFTRGLNTVGDYTLGADENLAYDFGSRNRLGAVGRGKYNPIGIAGRKLLGGRASELAGQIGHATAEHTQKAAQKANIHHSTAKAMVGMLGDGEGELGKGLTPRGHKLLKTAYPEIRDKKTGKVIGRSNIPKNGDTAGLEKLGHFLQDNSYDLTDAKYAGGELIEKSGTLSRFGLDPETKRATQQSVAGLVLASEGKISPDQHNRITQDMEGSARPGSVEAIVAADLQTQREQAGTQQRHTIRRGKSVMPAGPHGEFVSVYGDTEVIDIDGQRKPAYQSAAAAASLDTLREDAASSSKGEIWDDIKPIAVYRGGAERLKNATALLATAQGMPDGTESEKTVKTQTIERRKVELDEVLRRRELVSKAIGTWGRADPGGKSKADAVARAMGLGDDEIGKGSSEEGGAAEEAERARAAAEEAAKANEANGPQR